MIELDSLKNFCSVNYCPKFLLVQADRVGNIDVNGNEKEILGDFGCLYRSSEAFWALVY